MKRCWDLKEELWNRNLTHSGLVTPYGDRDLALRHQAITWTNVDWSSMKSSVINIREISQEMPQPSITAIHLKITYFKFPRGQCVKTWSLDILFTRYKFSGFRHFISGLYFLQVVEALHPENKAFKNLQAPRRVLMIKCALGFWNCK